MEQFIAAVELLRRRELRGRPVVVGGSGDPTQPRMVVATASYEARAYGVHSGMPLRAAARRCPEAVFLPTDAPAYEQASGRVMQTLRSMPVLVEVRGRDEAFVGSDTDDNWMAVMAERPVGELWGVGPKTSQKLVGLGVPTVADLATADEGPLVERFGPVLGSWLPRLARGEGDAEVVTTPWVARSRSRETTYPQDLTDGTEIGAALALLAQELGRDVFAGGRIVTRVAVRVRSSSFVTRTRIAKLPEPTTDVAQVRDAALRLPWSGSISPVPYDSWAFGSSSYGTRPARVMVARPVSGRTWRAVPAPRDTAGTAPRPRRRRWSPRRSRWCACCGRRR